MNIDDRLREILNEALDNDQNTGLSKSGIIEIAFAAIKEIMVEKGEHCKDCCCSQSWKALGIDHFTGKSIPQHIEELRGKVSTTVKKPSVEQMEKWIEDYGYEEMRVFNQEFDTKDLAKFLVEKMK